ncbi:MAG: metal-dependent transcriptional regulator [Acidimicrobiia bacterium]
MKASEYRTSYREYTAAIFELAEEGIPVIRARIAEWLGISRQAVTEVVRLMKQEGLVSTAGQQISLTDEGRHLAEVIVRRHRLAEHFLSEVLGMAWVKVHKEAEVWEQIISDDVEAAMWRHLADPKTCPHGNPIPGAGYKAPPIKPVSQMETGETRTLERISEELELDADMLGFLDESGLRPGAEVVVRQRAPTGTLTVQAAGEQAVGLGIFAAERIFVATG